jgi:alpha-tubulin suppressor-like RCC1 family protein
MRRLLSTTRTTRGGVLYSWGSGELGREFPKSVTSSADKSYVPLQILEPNAFGEIVSIAAGHTHSLFATEVCCVILNSLDDKLISF